MAEKIQCKGLNPMDLMIQAEVLTEKLLECAQEAEMSPEELLHVIVVVQRLLVKIQKSRSVANDLVAEAEAAFKMVVGDFPSGGSC